MTAKLVATRLPICLLAALLSASCNLPASSSSSPSLAQGQTRARPVDLDLDDVNGLRLFGKSNVAQDITFEGKAAVSVQQHTTASEGSDFDPAVDPSGKLLVFASTRHSKFSHLYRKATEGAALTQLTDDSSNDAQPAVSADGKRIAFASDRSGQWDIWIIDTSGRNPMQITNNPRAELHPSWSPDGKHLVYCRLNPRDCVGELWIAEVDIPAPKRFIGEGLFPAWSPKGDKIAFQKARQRGSLWFSIWTVTLDNGEPTLPTEVFSSAQFACIAPAWSSDGAQLAFACVVSQTTGADFANPQGGHADISIIDIDGRGMMRLTNGRGKNFSPSWSVDDRIFFTAKYEGNETIWSVKPFRPSLVPNLPPPPAPADRRAAQISPEEP